MGLLFTGGVSAVLSSATATDELASDQALVDQGRQLFLVGCASCHGRNAEGITTQDGTQYGPSLVGVGAAAVDFQVATGRMPMANPSVQAPKKDAVYNEEETRAMAAYVASLGPGPSIPTEEQYSVDGIPEGDREESVVRGGEFFRTNCTACHNFDGSGGALPGGKYAPSLKGVSEKHMYEAMVTGPQQMPVFSEDVLKPEEKRDVIAYVKSLENNPDYGGFAMGGLGPVAEGLFSWVVGIGVLVGFTIWIAAGTSKSQKGKKA